MFSLARFAAEAARSTRRVSFPERIAKLIRMEGTSSNRCKAKEFYPFCFPSPENGREGRNGRGGGSVGSNIDPSSQPPSLSQERRSLEAHNGGTPTHTKKLQSLETGRFSIEFPLPEVNLTRSYHTSFPPLASSNSSVSHQNISSTKGRMSGEQVPTKRPLDISDVDPKKQCLDTCTQEVISEFQDKTSGNRDNSKDGTASTSSCENGSSSDVPLAPDLSKFPRRWTSFTGHCDETRPPSSTDVEVSVLCYNVLAQCLIESNMHLYEHCPEEILTWSHRRMNLLKEIQKANVDIMCLQEVQASHFFEYFKPELEKLGYAAIYKKRTGDKHDGCAIFFKEAKFILERCKRVQFYRRNTSLLDRDNVAIVALFRSVGRHPQDAPRLCVATTHLLYNPKRGDIKLAQLGVLLAQIDNIAAVEPLPSLPPSEHSSPAYHPIILCGDFNSLPHSPLYNFIRYRRLDYVGLQKVAVSGQGSNRRSFDPLNWPLWPLDFGITDLCQFRSVVKERLGKGQETQEKCLENTNYPQDWEKQFSESIHHPFHLNSVHNHDGQVREVTTNHGRTNCTVDYLFYSTDPPTKEDSASDVTCRSPVWELRPLEYQSLLTDQQATEMGGLPNHALSSDHFPLHAKFLLYSSDKVTILEEETESFIAFSECG